MRCLCLLLAGLLIVPSLTRAADKPAGDVAKFQGKWSGLAGPGGNIPFTVTFEKEKVILGFEANGEEMKIEGEFVLNEKSSPPTIDWVKFSTPNGDEVPNNLGIYKIEGEKITFCSGGPGNERPTEFKAGEGGPPNLVVVTRVKEDKEKKEEIKGDLAKFQGKWKTKLGEMDLTILIKDKMVTASFMNDEGKEVKLYGQMSVNDASKPKAVDFTNFTGPDGNEMRDNLGIYTIDGDDKITICLGGAGNDRPTEFKQGDDGHSLLTLERVK